MLNQLLRVNGATKINAFSTSSKVEVEAELRKDLR